MKRLHLHVSVPDLAQSIQFYETLFGAPPTVVKADYAKWMLEDPRVNFAISQRSRAVGLDHVGIQVESSAELGELAARLKGAGSATFDQEAATCCYARSDKTWVHDPAGLRWETFYTFGEATRFGEDEQLPAAPQAAGACCGPEPAASAANSGACCGGAPEPAKTEPEARACCGGASAA